MSLEKVAIIGMLAFIAGVTAEIWIKSNVAKECIRSGMQYIDGDCVREKK